MIKQTTEHRKQFDNVDNDLRRKIWEENVQIRKHLRSSNESDHYWVYQLLVDESPLKANLSQSREGIAVPCSTLDRLKDEINLEQESSNVHKAVVNIQENVPRCSGRRHFAAREIAVQTPNWEEDKPTHLPIQQKTLQSDEQPEKCKEPIEHLARPLTAAEIIHNSPTKHDVSSPTETTSPKPSVQSLTRTSRNNFFNRKPTPFTPYGWNDSHKDVGEKKTFNVNAPANEVNKHALDTYKRRREEIERYLAMEAEEVKKASRGGIIDNANHASIWMTEYAENFSKTQQRKPFIFGPTLRPKSSPCSLRPSWWRSGYQQYVQ